MGIRSEKACSEQLWKFVRLRRRVLGVKRAVITAVLLLVHLSLAQAQTLSVTNEIVQLPQAGPVHLWSPDHQWMLVADALPLDHAVLAPPYWRLVKRGRLLHGTAFPKNNGPICARHTCLDGEQELNGSAVSRNG